jgi:CubicO group peptidase (beta-lactamase class C family)
MLVDRGLVSLADPVQRYIPEFTGGDRNQMRIHNLLNHTSGLPDMLPENEALRRKNTPLKEFVPRICKTPLLFAPGSKVQYQSMGIALLGEIVERVTGLPLREFLKQEIFDPLGMRNTFLGAGGRELASLVQCDVPVAEGDVGYERWDWNSFYWRNFGAPWGGMHSNVGDLAVFLQTMLNEGEYNGVRILKPSSARDMRRNQTQGLNLPWGWGWALAGSWEERYFGDNVSKDTYGHVGATGTVAWADPERQLMFICLTTRPLDQEKGQLFRDLSDMATEAGKTE